MYIYTQDLKFRDVKVILSLIVVVVFIKDNCGYIKRNDIEISCICVFEHKIIMSMEIMYMNV